MIRGMFSRRPYIEGAWMNKHQGVYYLQYAAPGTQYNTYSDSVYISSSPLGPFTPADSNPFSFKPGGFIPGAGHGSTMEDKDGSLWHVSTMRISKNHDFERRIGLWPSGFDSSGNLFCNQRYGDWPVNIENMKQNIWSEPEWMLLSVGKEMTASSSTPEHPPVNASEENVQTWWQAASADRSEWLMMDLGDVYKVHAVQVNFADDVISIPCPGEIRPGLQSRYIEKADLVTQWKLEGSADQENWIVLEDRSESAADLSHDMTVIEEGVMIRYLRLSNMAVPYGQKPCISGLRVFGLGEGSMPRTPAFRAVRENDLDMTVEISEQPDALGWNILFGTSADKLYHSCMVFSAGPVRIGALVKGNDYFVQVDAFNENGITHGTCKTLEGK